MYAHGVSQCVLLLDAVPLGHLFGHRSWLNSVKLVGLSAGLFILLMIQNLHYLKDPKPWELWYVPYYG